MSRGKMISASIKGFFGPLHHEVAEIDVVDVAQDVGGSSVQFDNNKTRVPVISLLTFFSHYFLTHIDLNLQLGHKICLCVFSFFSRHRMYSA